MRNALLVAIVGLATVSMFGCGDASSSTGNQRSKGGHVPADGEQQEHDPNAPAEAPSPVNPNSTSTPDKPADPGKAAGTLAVTLSTATPATDLGTTLDVTVTVAPKAGFTGAVALTAAGLPAGTTAAFSPASVTLAAAPVTSKMTITVPMTATPSAVGAFAPIVVKATAGAVEATANANFKVNSKITMTIPVNIDAMRAAVGTRYVDSWGGAAIGTAPAALVTQLDNPITIVVINKDSVGHIVHGANGFQHGSTTTPIPANGGTDPLNRTLKPGVAANGYLHEGANGTSESFRISVNAAP